MTKNNNESNNTKLAFGIAGVVVILIILAIALGLNILSTFDTQSGKDTLNSIGATIDELKEPATKIVITYGDVMNKDPETMEIEIHCDQFDDTFIEKVDSNVYRQIEVGGRYTIARKESTDIFKKTNLYYNIVYNRVYDGKDLDSLKYNGEVVSIEATVHMCWYDEDMDKYFVNFEFLDLGVNQRLTLEITEEIYNNIENSNRLTIIRNEASAGVSSVIYVYEVEQ